MNKNLILAALAALFIVGCGSGDTASTETTGGTTATAQSTTGSTPAVTVAFDLGSKKVGDKAVCVVCNAKEGSTAEEEVKSVVDYEGKTYAFCNDAEKADFISDPKKYAKK